MAEPPLPIGKMVCAENMLHLADCARPRATLIDDLARGEFGATLSNDALRRVRRSEEGGVDFGNNTRVAFNSP
jgi:hypothetical protein